MQPHSYKEPAPCFIVASRHSFLYSSPPSGEQTALYHSQIFSQSSAPAVFFFFRHAGFCAFVHSWAFFPCQRYGFLATILPWKWLLARCLQTVDWCTCVPLVSASSELMALHHPVSTGSEHNASFICCKKFPDHSVNHPQPARPETSWKSTSHHLLNLWPISICSV